MSNVYWVEEDKVIQCNIRDITARTERRNDSDSHLAALELANSTKDAWLIAQSQNLRPPLMAIAVMLRLMELAHKPEDRSDFEEAALQHVQRNFQRLVRFFNELADLTKQIPLQLESNQRSGDNTGVAKSINLTNPRL